VTQTSVIIIYSPCRSTYS